MEENRLTTMAIGYDEKLFNRLYKETEPLRRKLAGQIDARRFGLFYDDILSMFDIKFIFAFNKHWQRKDPPEKIKAIILNSLANFKCRILKAAYTHKFSQSITSLDGMLGDYEDLFPDNSPQENTQLDKALKFMKNNLSENAFTLLEIQLNPPPFILNKINVSKDKPLQKIPDHLILDYFGLGCNNNSQKYLGRLKKEIRNAVHYARISLS
jgi:hypothetical protein